MKLPDLCSRVQQAAAAAWLAYSKAKASASAVLISHQSHLGGQADAFILLVHADFMNYSSCNQAHRQAH